METLATALVRQRGVAVRASVRVQLLRRVLELALDLELVPVGIVTGTARTAGIAGVAMAVTVAAIATATVSCVLAGPARPALTSVFLRA